MSKQKLVVGILEQAVRSHFHMDLVRFLRNQYDLECHIYSYNPLGLEIYRRQAPELFDGFHLIDCSLSAEDMQHKRIEEKAAYYEERYGIPFGWFKLTDREHGLGFSPGGFYHPKSKTSDTATDLEVQAKYIKKLDYWEKELPERGIDILLNGFFFEYYPARAHNVPVRTALAARNENYYFWAHNCFGEILGLEEAYRAAEDVEGHVELDDAPVLNRKQLDVMMRRSRFSQALKRMGSRVLAWAYRTYKKDHKSYRLSSELYFIYREWRILRKLYSANLPWAKDLQGQKYLLYALQVEPEINFQGYSPEYFCQLNAIISLSRDLPADTKLVVKEHIPAAAKRPDQFYDQILMLKNVIFADPRENGLNLAKGATAVATINGTIGQEAAVLGKPVIAFGRRNLYNVLPHVRVVKAEEDLFPALRWALSDGFDRQAAAREGQKYIRKLQSLSFPMADFGYHNPKGHSADTIKQAAERLMQDVDNDLAKLKESRYVSLSAQGQKQ